MNLYEVLQVSPYASHFEIQQAYKKLTQEYYQIYKVNTNAPLLYDDAIKRLNYAYSILSDNQKRTEYDLKQSGSKSTSYNPNNYTRNYTNTYDPKSSYYNKPNTQTNKSKNIIIAIAITIIASVIFAIINNTGSNSLINSITNTPQAASFSQPEIAPPTSGIIGMFSTENAIAPFQIITNSNSGNYYVKLVDANNGSIVSTIFIRKGETINVKIPLGSYKMKFATGDTWYGENYLFGPNTNYYITDNTFNFSINGSTINGFTVNLNGSVAGNLPTNQINKNDW